MQRARSFVLVLFVTANWVVPAAAQQETAEEGLQRFFESTNTAFVPMWSDNVGHLQGLPHVISEGPCTDPPPPSDPYSLREDFNADGAPDAIELGVRDSIVVLVACLTTNAQAVCYDTAVASNRAFRARPRCSLEDVELAGVKALRLDLRELEPEDHPILHTHGPLVRLDRGFSSRLYCVGLEGIRLCGTVN